MASLNKRLLKAAEEGKVDEIAALLDQGADIDAAPPWGLTPLMEAISGKHEAAALYLIERGAHVGLACEVGSTALHWACGKGMERVVRELLKRGACVEAQDDDFQRPLHFAAEHGHESIVRLLVTEHGVQVDSRDRWGRTPLLLALHQGKEGVATFLASSGASWHAVNAAGWTALHRACHGGLTSIVVRLLDEFGFDLHEKTTRGESCLHFAAEMGHVETCRFLVERGIPFDVVGSSGRSPLFAASLWGHPRVLTLLLNAGANIERRDETGWSVLALASSVGTRNSSTTVPMLVERGARLDGPLPRDFHFPSLDASLTWVLSNASWAPSQVSLHTIFKKPDEPIPFYRRTLRWALTSPAVAALVEKEGWSLVAAAKTDEEEEEMREKRLSLLRDDAWERKKHLVIDRSLDWGYGESGKAPALEKAKPADEGEE